MFLAEICVFTLNHQASRGTLQAGKTAFACALGRGGLSARKREGDGTTPIGTYALRRLFYRPDRLSRPLTGLPVCALQRDTGWCEDPASPQYNRQIRVGPGGGIDRMWRDDHLYDLVVEIGYNDKPVVKGRGSAVFLHLARPGYGPTAGCVALSRADMLRLLPRLSPETVIRTG